MKIAVPFAVAEIIVFYLNFLEWFKILMLIVGCIASGSIAFYKSRKKQNIFTTIAVVFLAALVMRALQVAGLI